MAMPLGVIDSTALELDYLVCVGSSPCALTVVRVYLFCGGVELGFWAFRFTLGIEEDPIGILMNSSSTCVGRMGDSCSLEISTVSEVHSMRHSAILTMQPKFHSLPITLNSTPALSSTVHSTQLNNTWCLHPAQYYNELPDLTHHFQIYYVHHEPILH